MRTNEHDQHKKLEMTDADRKVLAADYAEGGASREKAQYFQRRYRTEQEQREFIDYGLKLRLPGQKGYRDKTAGLLGLFRSFLAALR